MYNHERPILHRRREVYRAVAERRKLTDAVNRRPAMDFSVTER
jgi:hypothetical protein